LGNRNVCKELCGWGPLGRSFRRRPPNPQSVGSTAPHACTWVACNCSCSTAASINAVPAGEAWPNGAGGRGRVRGGGSGGRAALTLGHAELLGDAHDTVARGHHIGLADACGGGKARGTIGLGWRRPDPGRSGSRRWAGGLALPGPDAAAAVGAATAAQRHQDPRGGGGWGRRGRGGAGVTLVWGLIAASSCRRPPAQCWVGLQVRCEAQGGAAHPNAWHWRPPRTGPGAPGPPA
jgi:hypothetical protein